MSNKPQFLGLEELEFKGDLNFRDIVRRQIYNCAIVASDEYQFPHAVNVLLKMLPIEIKEKEEFRWKLETCEHSKRRWEYLKNCGVPMGTPQNPVCGSPFLVEDSWTDWSDVFELCMEEFEKMGVTWQSISKAAKV